MFFRHTKICLVSQVSRGLGGEVGTLARRSAEVKLQIVHPKSGSEIIGLRPIRSAPPTIRGPTSYLPPLSRPRLLDFYPAPVYKNLSS